MRTDLAIELKTALSDVRTLLDALGCLRGATKQAGGFLIRCPWHLEKTPSCSVQLKQGSIIAHCFGCDASGDALDLIAACRGLDIRTRFRDVLREAAVLAGRYDVLDTLDADGPTTTVHSARQDTPSPTPPAPEIPDRTYPPVEEVETLWNACSQVTDDALCAAWLASRSLRPMDVSVRDLARALPGLTEHPFWMRYHRRSWFETGHRLLVPMLDALGRVRSVRARCVRAEGPDDAPKALPPTGYRMSGLIMADELGRIMLRAGSAPDWWPKHEPFRLVVVEGEPDFITWATAQGASRFAVLGIESGSWSEEIASRVPNGTFVSVRTHLDAAGNKYADRIYRSLAQRCRLARRRNPA